jgi:hypothetical protein
VHLLTDATDIVLLKLSQPSLFRLCYFWITAVCSCWYIATILEKICCLRLQDEIHRSRDLLGYVCAMNVWIALLPICSYTATAHTPHSTRLETIRNSETSTFAWKTTIWQLGKPHIVRIGPVLFVSSTCDKCQEEACAHPDGAHLSLSVTIPKPRPYFCVILSPVWIAPRSARR